jgi:sugar lactone lactonase YvrE
MTVQSLPLPLLEQRYAVGESPFWHAAQAAWYWVDIPARLIGRLADRAYRQWQLPEMVGCIAPMANGGLIAGMQTGMFSVQLLDDGAVHLTKLGQPEQLLADMRFNDGRCDRQGRFWSGTMCLDMALARRDGKLYSYSAAAGLSAPVVDDLIVQNGLAWSPDGKTMYLSDSHPSRRLIWAFDYDIDSGMPSRRRVFADLNQHRGRPDGAAMDVDGCYWSCANDAGCLLRFTPAGKLDRVIELPTRKPSMCAFGGAQLDTLIVTSISLNGPADDAGAGLVLTLNPGVCGMPETPFVTLER